MQIPNLRPPTAPLKTTEEGARRMYELKERGFLQSSGTGHRYSGPEFREFRTDWQNMMRREE